MVETAAVALLHGWADPMALLDTPAADWPIAVAVVSRAQELAADKRRNELDYLAGKTAQPIVKAFGQIAQQVVRAFRRSQV